MLCMLRSVVFLPGSVFILAKLFGINGIWLSLLMSEFLSLTVSVIVANVPKYTEKYIAAVN